MFEQVSEEKWSHASTLVGDNGTDLYNRDLLVSTVAQVIDGRVSAEELAHRCFGQKDDLGKPHPQAGFFTDMQKLALVGITDSMVGKGGGIGLIGTERSAPGSVANVSLTPDMKKRIQDTLNAASPHIPVKGVVIDFFVGKLCDDNAPGYSKMKKLVKDAIASGAVNGFHMVGNAVKNGNAVPETR